ncbi:MAG TPA: tRNA (adenosine(37)-N6)-dimethylallyltransferase MiaA [Phnomibacter sp.]|nr:tRNA (adenosine(37)-N6)-dimethylallyltransferase MiaA [Phnomibacter sp.]
MARPKTLVEIAGPTAVGKTAISIQLATRFKTAILSFDSRQCYREMNIGVARPSETELQQATHYFIASHSVHTPVDAAAYEQYALDTLHQLFQQHDVVIAVGGTGLYLKALCEGLDAMPEIPEATRNHLRQQYQLNGLPWLKDAVQKADPVFAADGEMENPHRMLRALEIVTVSGRSIRHFQQQQAVTRDFSIVKIGIELPREILVSRIHQRVDAMMQQGQEQEALQLYPHKNLQALQTVGYQELFDYFDGKCTLSEAVEQIKTHTRQYAKRQMTWFKKDAQMHWFAPTEAEAIAHYIDTVIS